MTLEREQGGVTFVRPEDVLADIAVTPPYLARSYASYRALRDSPVRTAVFLDMSDAYCSARARETGLEVEQLVFQVWTVRDGRAVGAEVYPTEAEALRAVGLEDEPAP